MSHFSGDLGSTQPRHRLLGRFSRVLEGLQGTGLWGTTKSRGVTSAHWHNWSRKKLAREAVRKFCLQHYKLGENISRTTMSYLGRDESDIRGSVRVTDFHERSSAANLRQRCYTAVHVSAHSLTGKPWRTVCERQHELPGLSTPASRAEPAGGRGRALPRAHGMARHLMG